MPDCSALCERLSALKENAQRYIESCLGAMITIDHVMKELESHNVFLKTWQTEMQTYGLTSSDISDTIKKMNVRLHTLL